MSTSQRIMVEHDLAFPCKKYDQVCSAGVCQNRSNTRSCRHARKQCYADKNMDLKNAPEEFDNMDVIDGIFGKKELPADERIASRAIIHGDKNKRAIDGAVRATREQFNCHFEDELREHARRDWYGENDYDTPNMATNDLKWFQDIGGSDGHDRTQENKNTEWWLKLEYFSGHSSM